MISQAGQDKWVLIVTNEKREGFFLDIGAFDGVTISNTYLLEVDYGWKGIAVEAGYNNYQKLISNRRCKCLNLALNTTDDTVLFKEDHTVGKICKEGIPVHGITFSSLLKDCPREIDYISLDIEGFEYECLKQFPFDDYKVRCWTIEHNAHLDEGIMRDQIKELMWSKGYTRWSESPAFEDWWW